MRQQNKRLTPFGRLVSKALIDRDMTRSALAADFEKNRAKIQAATGVKPTAFAFPFGALSKESRKVLKEEGYQVVFTCTEEVNHLTGDPDELRNLGRFNRANGLDREALFQKFT